MGIAVRFTTAKGETPAIPDVTTTTAVIGETARASVVAKCIGIIITTAGTCSPAAIFGIRLANDINGALPEPITMAQMAMTSAIIIITPIPPRPECSAPLITASTVPIVVKPFANISPATTSVTTLANCVPMPSKNACTSSIVSRKLCLRKNSTNIVTVKLSNITTTRCSSDCISPTWARNSEPSIRINGITGKMA